MQRLRISKNRRFFRLEDGTPFFWLGDTAWELFHALDREEADEYLENRAALGFNVIQAVGLAEKDGVRTGNAYGRRPLRENEDGQYDPALPAVTDDPDDYDYWDHVDYIIDQAASWDLYVAFLPTWGDKFNDHRGRGPNIFNGHNARTFGLWLGKRYKDRDNLVWILGGDRRLNTLTHFQVIHGMAEGIREGGAEQLISFHPRSQDSSLYYLGDAPWLDFSMIQSGHGALHRPNYPLVQRDYEHPRTMPTMDAEPRYEDHPVGFRGHNGYFDDKDVREAVYWSVFAGGAGVTYGHQSIWSMTREPGDYYIMTWQDALNRPGARQMQHAKALVESRPFFERVPDQELLVENYEGANHMQAARGTDYAFIYSPCGLPMEVKLGMLTGQHLNVHWYDPRSGSSTSAGTVENRGKERFIPPSSGRRDDWVLVLDDGSRGYEMA